MSQNSFYKASQEIVNSQDGIKKANETRRKIVPAGMYEAFFAGVSTTASKSSQAKALTYNFVITSGEETRGTKLSLSLWHTNREGQAIAYAPERQVRNLNSYFGLGEKDAKTFVFPKDEKDQGDYVKLMGRPVTLTVENKVQAGGAGAGQLRAEIIRVAPRLAAASDTKAA